VRFSVYERQAQGGSPLYLGEVMAPNRRTAEDCAYFVWSDRLAPWNILLRPTIYFWLQQ